MTHNRNTVTHSLYSSIHLSLDRGYSLSLKTACNLRSECVNWFRKAEVSSTGPGSVFWKLRVRFVSICRLQQEVFVEEAEHIQPLYSTLEKHFNTPIIEPAQMTNLPLKAAGWAFFFSFLFYFICISLLIQIHSPPTLLDTLYIAYAQISLCAACRNTGLNWV